MCVCTQVSETPVVCSTSTETETEKILHFTHFVGTGTRKTQKNIFSTTVRSTGTRVLVHQMEV